MELYIQILLSIIAMICLVGGSNLLIKGVGYFLPEGTPPQPRLDNLMRFLSGMYLGMAFLIGWVVFHIEEHHHLIYLMALVVALAGTGRVYSQIKVGSAGTYLNFVAIMEILLGIALTVLQYYRA